MTIWIMPEFDRKEWAVCLFWLQGGKHDAAPTDRNSRLLERQWGTLGHTNFLEGQEHQQDHRANSI